MTPARPPGAAEAVAGYLRTFTGFERDARIFLLTTLVSGAAISLYWIDFNLYLESVGLSPEIVGLVVTVGSIAGAVAALPAAALSDRLGRRLVMIGGTGLVAIAFCGLLATTATAPIFALSACYGAGVEAVGVVTSPYLAEHSRREHRNELFAVQFALQSATNIGAALVGGVVAGWIAGALGLEPGAGAYRVIIGMMAILSLAALGILFLLRDDRPRRRIGSSLDSRPPAEARPSRRFGLHVEDRGRMARLLLPGFLTSLGAGQIIPFLNLFIQGKFHLDLASINAVFALTSVGTLVAIMLQPALARRFGKVASVVIVQFASIPFFVVLGWSPLLWSVVIAMAVRNSLMNAGNPIQTAFAMEHLLPAERATYAALATLLWSVGWSIAGPFYSAAQGALGFQTGYALNFLTVIVLYSVGTLLYWVWFHDSEARPGPVAVPAPEPLS